MGLDRQALEIPTSFAGVDQKSSFDAAGGLRQYSGVQFLNTVPGVERRSGDPVDQASQRELRILTEIAEQENVTQRGLSKSLGIALGLTNLYLKRLARKGYIKITTIPPNRLKYLVTPQGFAAKTLLTYEYMTLSLALYKQTRRTLREALRPLVTDGVTRFALYGVGEAAELAYLTLREHGVEPVAVYAEGSGGSFLGLPVLAKEEIPNAAADRVIVASFGPTSDKQLVDLLELIPREKLILLGRDGA